MKDLKTLLKEILVNDMDRKKAIKVVGKVIDNCEDGTPEAQEWEDFQDYLLTLDME